MQQRAQEIENNNIKIMTQGADLMAKNKEDFEKASVGQSEQMMERFQSIIDQTAKAIEDEINANVLSKQRVFEVALKKLENQMTGVEEVKRKVDKNYQEG